MKSNEQLQKDVLDSIKWEPLLKAAEIGVTVMDGIVTLTGEVDSYAKKTEAECAAQCVAGVKAVVEKIEVKYHLSSKVDDNDIAKEVVNAFKWNWEVPNDKIKVKVEKGFVTLEGELHWNFQKEAARRTVKNLTGVTGVNNLITIKSETNDAVEKQDIESAFIRSWSLDPEDIQVSVSDNEVTLTGTVTSLYQKEEAARLAWNAPGVWRLDNQLEVVYDYAMVD